MGAGGQGLSAPRDQGARVARVRSGGRGVSGLVRISAACAIPAQTRRASPVPT